MKRITFNRPKPVRPASLQFSDELIIANYDMYRVGDIVKDDANVPVEVSEVVIVDVTGLKPSSQIRDVAKTQLNNARYIRLIKLKPLKSSFSSDYGVRVAV